MASSVAVDRNGLIYVLQRGSDADPVIVVDRQGRVVRSWGRGLYKIPHSIRIDGDGNVWTVDAGSSMVYKFSADGKQLLEINVGGLPTSPRSAFCGTTDIAFARDRILIADGYANARIVEYSNEGKRLREWGVPGEGPGPIPDSARHRHRSRGNHLCCRSRERSHPAFQPRGPLSGRVASLGEDVLVEGGSRQANYGWALNPETWKTALNPGLSKWIERQARFRELSNRAAITRST